ncbi:hypothetical protein WJX84_010307 [Apatococcus fuscideae]|uniref:Uncharacterized protein n=1 Tax=Apatococcus fuscideae TaxID=2026836 RepID=A0AAW1SY37_9CHLO
MKNRRDEVRDSGSRWPFSVCFNRDLLYCEGFCRKAVAGQLEHDNLAHITGAIRTGSFSKGGQRNSKDTSQMTAWRNHEAGQAALDKDDNPRWLKILSCIVNMCIELCFEAPVCCMSLVQADTAGEAFSNLMGFVCRLDHTSKLHTVARSGGGLTNGKKTG